MGTITARYDRSAARYERWWAPVLAPGIALLLDAVDGSLGAKGPTRTPGVAGPDARPSGQVAPEAGPARILDIGAGTGALARAAIARWPTAGVVALDGSRAMLEVGRGEAERSLTPDAAGRIDWRIGSAEALPFEDAAFDLALSSFVFQLVPDRRAALREALRVLAPGGRLAYVTWLADGASFAPETAFEAALDDEGIDEDPDEDEEDRSGDVASPAAAAAQLRRAGFGGVRAHGAVLERRWTARTYLAFLERYDAAELFESLPWATRRRLRRRTAERLDGLPRSAFTWRAPIVIASGRRPG